MRTLLFTIAGIFLFFALWTGYTYSADYAILPVLLAVFVTISGVVIDDKVISRYKTMCVIASAVFIIIALHMGMKNEEDTLAETITLPIAFALVCLIASSLVEFDVYVLSVFSIPVFLCAWYFDSKASWLLIPPILFMFYTMRRENSKLNQDN